MGVQKRADGYYEVHGYLAVSQRKPGEGPKRYLGRRKLKREADQLLEDHKRQMRGKSASAVMTVREYSERWLVFKHGPNTRRPVKTTLQFNRQALTKFLNDFGEHSLDGIRRDEALDWCLKHTAGEAKTVSAMFNDAVNDDRIQTNPFANRQHKQARGRKDITPMTEAEVDLLGELAVEIWGEPYGKTCRAWILFSAWVGTRPGETFKATWDDLDVKEGLLTVTRVKPPYNTDVIVVAQKALQACLELPEREGLLFRTVTGKKIDKGSNRYYWDPVRKAFETKITAKRKVDLLNGRPDLDLYEARHFCASQIVEAGGNEFDCAAQLGNTPEVCREIYIHSYEDKARDRLRRFLDGGDIRSLDAQRKLKEA